MQARSPSSLHPIASRAITSRTSEDGTNYNIAVIIKSLERPAALRTIVEIRLEVLLEDWRIAHSLTDCNVRVRVDGAVDSLQGWSTWYL